MSRQRVSVTPASVGIMNRGSVQGQRTSHGHLFHWPWKRYAFTVEWLTAPLSPSAVVTPHRVPPVRVQRPHVTRRCALAQVLRRSLIRWLVYSRYERAASVQETKIQNVGTSTKTVGLVSSKVNVILERKGRGEGLFQSRETNETSPDAVCGPWLDPNPTQLEKTSMWVLLRPLEELKRGMLLDNVREFEQFSSVW